MTKNLSLLKNTLLATIVFFAGIHLIIISTQALLNWDISYLNIFGILELKEFLPKPLTDSFIGDIISFGFVAFIFILFYLLKQKRT